MSLNVSLRIAIATDLHYSKDESGNIATQVCAKGTGIDPMESLISLLASPDSPINSAAEILICPGDITTGACIQSFEYGWKDLVRLKNTLNAENLIAATGNHEVGSRAGDGHLLAGNAEMAIEPFEHLMTTPDYPAKFAKADQKWVYWGRGFEVITGTNWVVVTINSCHYHSSLLPNEYERGRIGNAALSELRENLDRVSKDYEYRIIVLHHPPLAHEELDVSLGRTAMYNGALLLQMLEDTSEDWLVIHGHKHLFRLTKSGGADYAPMVLGAASFGALLSGDLANKTKNQFYIIELTNTSDDGVKRLRGKIDSLCWDSTSWALSSERAQGLPHGCGFDMLHPAKAQSIAVKIKKMLDETDEPFITWHELARQIEALNYLMPKDIQHLHKKLDEIGVFHSPGLGSWFPLELWVNK
jgi:Icc-related predicted phosphoesterase